MANEKIDGASITRRVELSLKQSAGKIAFKNYALDALYSPATDDMEKAALKRLQNKQNGD